MPRKPKPLAEGALYDYALKSLAARARSVAEMRRMLDRRAERREDVGTVMARLKERGYLNDARFAESYAHWRIENQRFGRARVAHDLRAHRVAPELAERVSKKAFEGVDEAELLERHLAPKLRYTGPPKTPNKVASLYRALRRAGFSHTVVMNKLRELKADVEVLENLEE